jgi:hypothetical protein
MDNIIKHKNLGQRKEIIVYGALLLRKAPEWYGKFGWSEGPDMPAKGG